MNATLTRLVDTLDAEAVTVAELVESLQQDQQRIVKHDITGLEASNLRKEECILHFQMHERTRQELTRELGSELGLPADQVRVSTLCPLLGPDGEQLESTAAKLSALVSSLDDLAAISRGFLEQSILGIRGLLNLIQTLQSPAPGTYDASGRHAVGQPGPVSVRREA